MAVTPAQVQRIIAYDTVLIPDVQPFIDDAVIMATAVIGNALSDAQFDLVVRYLAAHLVAVTDPRLQSEQVKSLLASYQHKLSPGLGITHWGTTAMLLDTSGKLANWNKGVVDGVAGAFQIIWGGKPSDEPPAEGSV